MNAAPTMSEVLLEELTRDRDATLPPPAPTKLHVTLELEIPGGVSAAEYKAALLCTLEAFRSRRIRPRVWRVTMGPTRDLPSVTVVFREPEAGR